MTSRLGAALIIGLILTAAVFLLSRAFPGALATESGKLGVVHTVGFLMLLLSSLVLAEQIRGMAVIRYALIWVGIFLALITGFAYREELQAVATRVQGELVPAEPRVEDGGAQISLRAAPDGHFHVKAFVNDRPVQFLIDTGASDVTLTPSDARRIGIDVERLTFNVPYRTANGIAYGARIKLDAVRVGPIEIANVTGSVLQQDIGTSLLGMSFLGRLSSYEANRTRFTMYR